MHGRKKILIPKPDFSELLEALSVEPCGHSEYYLKKTFFGGVGDRRMTGLRTTDWHSCREAGRKQDASISRVGVHPPHSRRFLGWDS